MKFESVLFSIAFTILAIISWPKEHYNDKADQVEPPIVPAAAPASPTDTLAHMASSDLADDAQRRPAIGAGVD